MKKVEIENLEVELLVETIFKRYGYDFRHYSQASLKRRIYNFLSKMNFTKPTEILPQLLYDRTLFESLIYNLSIPVTEIIETLLFIKQSGKKLSIF